MNPVPTWLEMINDEDRTFIKRFVLASGSLKNMAESYGVTYPTVRLRLDRLIAKINVLESMENLTDFERLLRAMFAEGKIEKEDMKTLLLAFNKEREEKKS